MIFEEIELFNGRKRQPMDEKLKYNKVLWIEIGHCDGKHFLLGNPHTYKGRIHAYCPKKDTTFCISLCEITKMSKESRYWISGYLSGNEPAPPEEFDGETSVDYFQSQRYKSWEKQVKHFREKGELGE
ncbi:hypothetical protein [Mariniradius saccharolyticus]|nr:hypothetical protein [Mariniradius saccharolyticus]